jgi:hypothetical protein
MGSHAYMSIKFCAVQQKISALHPRGRINDLFKDLNYDAAGSAKGTTPEERVARSGNPL